MSQVPLPSEDSSSATSDKRCAALRFPELELEEKQAEREREERQAEREERKSALKAEKRIEQRAIEKRRRELEITVAREQAKRDALLKTEQLKLKHEIRLVELKTRQAKTGNAEGVNCQTPSDRSGAGNLALQTKRFGEMMRHVLPKMPLESAELSQFFKIVLYAMYEVPAEVQAKILITLFSA